jgi:hypothetical protein
LAKVIVQSGGSHGQVSPGAGAVTFISRKPPVQVLCKLGAGSATTSGGVGGWVDAEVPGRETGIEWGSTPGEVLTVPLLFDGLAAGRSMESAYKALRALGKPPVGARRGTPPPVLRLDGMVPHYGREWVVDDIQEGEVLWDGVHRIRLFVSVILKAYRPLDVVVLGAGRRGSGPPTRMYSVKRGDTLGSIARDELGADTASLIASAVAAIKKLNAIRDPKSIRPGQKLKLPRYQDTVGAKTAA